MVHQKLLNSLTPEQLKTLNKESVRGQIGMVVEKLVLEEQLPMTLAERERLIEQLQQTVRELQQRLDAAERAA